MIYIPPRNLLPSSSSQHRYEKFTWEVSTSVHSLPLISLDTCVLPLLPWPQLELDDCSWDQKLHPRESACKQHKIQGLPRHLPTSRMFDPTIDVLERCFWGVVFDGVPTTFICWPRFLFFGGGDPKGHVWKNCESHKQNILPRKKMTVSWLWWALPCFRHQDTWHGRSHALAWSSKS